MAETLTKNYQDCYGPDYPYLRLCQDAWKKKTFQTWILMRTYLEIIKPLKLPKGSRILSVGGGMGQIEQFLASPFGYDVTLVDFNLPSLQTAKNLFDDKVNLTAANALHLPFPSKVFDAVISFDLMEHLPDLTSAQQAFQEMKRVINCGPMLHKITVLGEEGINQDETHHIKKSARDWQEFFYQNGWETFKPLKHYIPLWSRKKIGLYPVEGAFYLRENKFN